MSDNGFSPSPRSPAPSEPAPPAPAPAQPEPPARRRWYQFVGPAIFALFCIELGVLLVLAPWLDLYDRNVYQFVAPAWRPFLLSHHFRGGLSALGFLNFLVALNELIDLARSRSSKP